MKKLVEFNKILRDNQLGSKVWIYMSTKTTDEMYDPYEKNYTVVNLNPVAVPGYVRSVSPEALVYKQYGLAEMGAVELLCEARYKHYFTLSNRVVIDGNDYQVYREGTGNRTIIQDRPHQMIRVILTKAT
jgi:hypothetical protein